MITHRRPVSRRMPVFRRVMGRLAGIAVLAATALPLATGSAAAADPRILGSFGEWTAYAYKEPGGKVCYMASQPRKAEGDYTQRGDIFALLTHRPGEKSLNVVSIVAGYSYKEGSEVSLRIDRKDWSLFTQGERAWARDSKTDAAIADGLRKGTRMVVKGTSSRGTETTDTYSLTGSNAAYEAISRECGVKVD